MSKTKEKIYQLVNDELINVLVEMSQIADNHKNETHLNENIIEKALADNVEIIQTGSCNKRVNLQFVLESLASDFSCNEVLIEAGPSLSGAFIETGLVDELILYIAPKILGSDGKPLLAITGLQSLDECQGFSVQKLTKIGEDIKLTLRAGQ